MKLKAKDTTKYLVYGMSLFAVLLVLFLALGSDTLSPASVTDDSFWTIDEITYREGVGYTVFITVTYDNDHPIYYDLIEESAICETFDFKFYCLEGYRGRQVIEGVNIPYGTSYQMEFTDRELPGELTNATLIAHGFNEDGYRYVEAEELIIPIEPNPDTGPEPGVQTESAPGFTIFVTLFAVLFVRRFSH